MSNAKTSSKTVGFGVKNELLGEFSGIFINVVLDSVTEQLILDDNGEYDLEVLKLLLSHKDSELYKTGESKPERDLDKIKERLLSK